MARSDIRFLLDGQPVTLANFPATRTVLEYLREDLTRTGTKEGCGEGDCGACMVVIGTLDGESVQYQPINACIQFLAALDGKALFTVESLAAGGTLHPAQRAMVEQHGSQCGFCTPGFVMTLFALRQANDTPPTRVEVDDALAGNLCRCTGYRPIVAAAEAMYAPSDWTPPWGDEAALVDALKAIQPTQTLNSEDTDAKLIIPVDVDALADAYLQHPDATLVAGSTDTGLWVTKQYRELGTVIAIADVPELNTLHVDDNGIHAGAAVTLARLTPPLTKHYPELTSMLRRWASPPIRNAATIGGNIANGSPIGDSMPALIALGATLTLRRGTDCRTLALEALYHDYMVNDLRDSEFVASVQIPPRNADQVLACYKISKRFDQDISALCAGFSVTLNDGTIRSARIAFGGMAGTVKRATHCEAALQGQPFSLATITAAQRALADDYTPMSDMRASDGYRRQVAANLLQRFYLETTGEAQTDVYNYAR